MKGRETLREEAVEAARRFCEAEHGQRREFKPGDRIPYAGRVFDGEEVAALVDASLDFWLTAGRYAARFERELASFLGVKHCSLVKMLGSYPDAPE